MISKTRLALLLTCALAAPLTPALADDAMPCHGHAAAAADPVLEPSASQLTLPDVTLTDQHGKAVQLASLVDGRTIAINFVFTSCTTICPPMGANFAKLGRLLGDRLGKDVELVSISIDPAVDTPARLAAWQQKFGVTEGWTLLTGSKVQVDRVLKAFGVATGSPSAHQPILFVGRGSQGSWQRLYGMTPPAQILESLDRLAVGQVAREKEATR